MQNKYLETVPVKLKRLYGYKYSKIAAWALFFFIAFYDLFMAMSQIYEAKKEVSIYGEVAGKPLTVNIRKDIINRIENRLEAREKILSDDLAKSYKNPFLPYSSPGSSEPTIVP